MTNLFEEFKMIFESDKDFIISSPYMINRLLSFSKSEIQSSIECNEYVGRIPKELLLKIYKSRIKQGKAPFVKTTKIPKEKSPKLISAICRYFNCNKFHAKQIINICNKKNIKIEEIFGLKKNE